nr:hypothetical protein [Colwellia sp. M166]
MMILTFIKKANIFSGDMVIYEPHSFMVSLSAKYQGKTFNWQYDNFEGRTKITDDVAKAMEIATDFVGSSTFHETVEVYGKLTLPADATSNVYAFRFDGLS